MIISFDLSLFVYSEFEKLVCREKTSAAPSICFGPRHENCESFNIFPVPQRYVFVVEHFILVFFYYKYTPFHLFSLLI